MDSDYERMFNASSSETCLPLSNLSMGGMSLSRLSTSEVELKLFPDATVCNSVENNKNLHMAGESCEDQDVFCYSGDLPSGLFSILSDTHGPSLLDGRSLGQVSSFSSSEPLTSPGVPSSSVLLSPAEPAPNCSLGSLTDVSSHKNYSYRHTQPLSHTPSKEASSVFSLEGTQSLERERHAEDPVTAKSTAVAASAKDGWHLSDDEPLAMECEDDTEPTEAGCEQALLVCSDDDDDDDDDGDDDMLQAELAEKAADFQLPDSCELFSDGPSKSPASAGGQQRDNASPTMQLTSGRQRDVQRNNRKQKGADKTSGHNGTHKTREQKGAHTTERKSVTLKTEEQKSLKSMSEICNVVVHQTPCPESSVSLNLSVVIHTHPMLHSCGVCNGCYHQTSKVELLHVSCVCTCDQKSIACKQCDMAFVWTCGLTKHMAFHNSVASGTNLPWNKYSTQRKIVLAASKQNSSSKPQKFLFCCWASGCKTEFATAKELVSHMTQSHYASHNDELHGEPVKARAVGSHPTSKSAARVIDPQHPITPVTEEERPSPPLTVPSPSQPVTPPHASAKSFSSVSKSLKPRTASGGPGTATQQLVGFRTCIDCGEQFDKVTAWKRHQKNSWHSEKRLPTTTALTYMCQKCGVGCERVEQLQQHYRSRHHAQCRACPDSFSSHSELADHYCQQHSHACALCRQVLTSPRLLHAHSSLAHPVTRHCRSCGLQVAGDQALAEHYSTAHSFPCSECHQVFRDSGELVNHCTLHRSLGFQCQACQQVFRKLEQLAQHYLTQHTGQEEAAH